MPSSASSFVGTNGSVSVVLSESSSGGGPAPKTLYRVVVMGSAKVGKTALISRFIKDSFVADYKPTIEEMHREEYDVAGTHLVLDILDTSGAYQFPAMRALSIAKADGFILVYAVDDANSFVEVCQLREQILQSRMHTNGLESGMSATQSIPIVVVANKSDLSADRRTVQHATAETTVCIDWEHGFVETSAKHNRNVVAVFKSLMSQANVPFSPVARRRRGSLPPSFLRSSTSHAKLHLLKRHSCVIS